MSAADLKVLHVIGGLGPGGAETLLYRLATRPSHVEHRIVCLGGRDWYSQGLEQHGVEVDYLELRPATAWTALPRLRRIVKASGADVVQGWMYRSNLLASLAARSLGVPSAWSIHCASLEPLSRRARFWAYASGALAGVLPDHIVNCSVRSAEMHATLGFGRAPVTIVPNGYSGDAFAPDEARSALVRSELGIASGEFVLGTLSRWHEEKDIPNLLQALALLNRRGLRLRALLIGHRLDTANAELAAAARRCGVLDQLGLLGRRDDVPDLLRAIDLHVLPSRSESFPNSIAEAMLSATPCVATDAGDTRLMIGGTGWIAPPGDPAALADRIAEAHDLWRSDRAAWGARRSAARERILSEFPLDRMAQAYERIWRSLAQRR